MGLSSGGRLCDVYGCERGGGGRGEGQGGASLQVGRRRTPFRTKGTNGDEDEVCVWVRQIEVEVTYFTLNVTVNV